MAVLARAPAEKPPVQVSCPGEWLPLLVAEMLVRVHTVWDVGAL